MASFGHDGKSIARALDRTPQAVRVKAVEIGVRLRPPKMEHRRIKLSVQAWRALQTEADRLGTSAGRLARLVIETVARDRLFSAVIDVPTATGRNALWTASSCVRSFASMSALPPKAEIDLQSADVCFVPKADIGRRKVLHQVNSGLGLGYWRMR
jgi:hypothetical protein